MRVGFDHLLDQFILAIGETEVLAVAAFFVVPFVVTEAGDENDHIRLRGGMSGAGDHVVGCFLAGVADGIVDVDVRSGALQQAFERGDFVDGFDLRLPPA